MALATQIQALAGELLSISEDPQQALEGGELWRTGDAWQESAAIAKSILEVISDYTRTAPQRVQTNEEVRRKARAYNVDDRDPS